jgi:hypothetical protein
VNELVAGSIGHRVPTHDFVGSLHSVFARACNISMPGLLVTIAADRNADGPTNIVLRSAIPPDLRACFSRGVAVRRRLDRIEGPGVCVQLYDAHTWSPERPGAFMQADLRINVAHSLQVMRRRSLPAGLLAGVAREPAARLVRALQARDVTAVAGCVRALVGLGEGLTPSGDDFLVGVMAGLELASNDESRREFHAQLIRAVTSMLDRTTDLSAHLLRLAAAGHFSGVLERLRSALSRAADPERLDRALHAALQVGASSGADTVSGVLAALDACVAMDEGVTA